MRAAWERTVEPLVEPLDLKETCDWLRVDQDRDKAAVTELIAVARQYAEDIGERALIEQTWALTLDTFPCNCDRSGMFEGNSIYLPMPPLLSVTSVEYWDEDGVQITLDASLYQVTIAGQRGRVAPALDEVWPATYGEMGDVVITYTAGYGTTPASIPSNLRQSLREAVSYLYVFRTSVDQDQLDKIFRRYNVGNY